MSDREFFFRIFIRFRMCAGNGWSRASFFSSAPGEETSSFLYILRGKFDTFFHSGNRWVVSFVSLGTKRRRRRRQRYLRASPHVKIWIMSIVWSSRHILEFMHTAFSHTIAATIFCDKKILLSNRANEDRSFSNRAFSYWIFLPHKYAKSECAASKEKRGKNALLPAKNALLPRAKNFFHIAWEWVTRVFWAVTACFRTQPSVFLVQYIKFFLCGGGGGLQWFILIAAQIYSLFFGIGEKRRCRSLFAVSSYRTISLLWCLNRRHSFKMLDSIHFMSLWHALHSLVTLWQKDTCSTGGHFSGRKKYLQGGGTRRNGKTSAKEKVLSLYTVAQSAFSK